MVSTRNLDYFVNIARRHQPGLEWTEKNLSTESKIAAAIKRLDKHQANFTNIGEELARLGVSHMETKEVKDLGKFWTEQAVEDVLKGGYDSRVRKELCLGLAEMMKSITAFTDALIHLAEIYPELRNDIIGTNGKLHLETADGYQFGARVSGKYTNDNGSGIDLWLSERDQQQFMATPDRDTWAKYSQKALPGVTSQGFVLSDEKLDNPGGWKENSPVATIALTQGTSNHQNNGGTVLLEHGRRSLDNQYASKAWIKGTKGELFQNTDTVNRIDHAFYGDANPLFTRAKY